MTEGVGLSRCFRLFPVEFTVKETTILMKEEMVFCVMVVILVVGSFYGLGERFG